MAEPLRSRAAVLAWLAELIAGIRLEHPTRVAFDGPDAAGKTTLADELASILAPTGREVIRASVDGFHRPRAARYARGRDSPVGYYEDSFDHATLRRVLLEPLGPGGARRYVPAAFDLRTDSPASEPLACASSDAILLFDGVFLQHPELRSHFDLCVFVSISLEEMVRRALERDVPRLGSREEVARRYRARYVPGQRLYDAVVRPRELADVVVANDEPAAPVLARVGRRALSPGTGRPAR
jgi:uridine kinase